MKRNTIPKRTIACIVALALVVSCLVTAYAGSILAFNGDSNGGQCDLKITTAGARIEYEVGDEADSTTNSYIGSPPLGTQCKFTATDTKSRVFLYWQDEYSGRVYSFERTIEFTASSRMHLRAMSARVSATEHVVSFVNYGGTVMKKETATVGKTVTEPTDTKVPGFTFTGWSKSASEVASDSSDMVVYAQYAVNDESYTVTLTNDDYVSGAGTYSNFQTVNLKAEEKNGAGESFSYWKDADGTIVSYERNYSFRINYDTTLTAVYGEAVTPQPVIRISKIYRDQPDMKLTFYAERSVPETYTVLSHGILMASGSTVGDSQMTVSSASDTSTALIRKVCGSSNERCGTFSLAKTRVSYVTEVTARPFMIVQDGSGSQFVVYGDIIRTTNGAEG